MNPPSSAGDRPNAPQTNKKTLVKTSLGANYFLRNAHTLLNFVQGVNICKFRFLNLSSILQRPFLLSLRELCFNYYARQSHFVL